MSRPIEIDDPTPAGIAGAIARMISSGELAPGDRLPTVRELSAQLGVSPATVSHGWQALSQAGLVVSRGRSGTFVTEAKSSAPQPAPPRAARMVKGATAARLDLSLGTPDPALLPELGPLLAHVALNSEPTDYHQAPVVPELGRLLQQDWPTASGGLTVVDGAMDAVARGLRAVVRYGDRVIVENPTFPHFLDYLESVGAQPIPVAMDERGVLPDEFERALALAPAAAVIQPRAQNPTGASMDADRIKDLAMILRRSETPCVVLEDDHSGSIIPTPDLSIGRWLPDQVLHVRSYSKSHGPDLRIAALSGPEEVIDRVVATRMLGPGWTPRILQRLLYELLQDDTAIHAVANARTQYRIRRSSFVDALDRNGVRVPPGEGLNVWVPVADERSALVHLAANGVRVAPGGPFYADPHNHPQAVRVTISPLRGGGEEVARILAATSEPHQGDYFSLGGPDRDSPPRRGSGRMTPGMR